MTTKFDLSKLKASLDRVGNGFDGIEAKIGFPSNLQYEDGTSVAFVATIQNYGAPAAKIPARSFMEPTVHRETEKWTKILSKGVGQVARGDATAFDVLDLAGAVASVDVQETITDIHEPELSAVTVLLRKWRKEGRTITGKTVGEAAAAIAAGVDPGTDNKPLNATGYLLASVRHGVSKTDEEDFTA